MLTTKDIYNSYKAFINLRLSTADKRVNTLMANRLYIERLLRSNKTFVEYNLGIPIDRILVTIKYNDVDKLQFPSVVVRCGTMDSLSLRVYLKAYIKANRLVKKAVTYRSELIGKVLPYKIFKTILTTFNTEMIDCICNGYWYSIGNGLGSIGVELATPKLVINNGKLNGRINWRESLKVRERIVKEQDPQLYDSFKRGELGEKEFIIKSRKYVYDKEENPTGEKWLIYHQTNHPFVKWRKPLGGFANKSLYSIKVTDYNNTGQNIAELSTSCIKEQIKDLNLGIIDKVMLYTNLDKDHINKFVIRNDV